MEVQPKIRVLLVDDHPLFRNTMRSLLAPYPDVEVVGEAIDGPEAVQCVEHLQPALVLMDIHLQQAMDGIAATRLILSQNPGVAILGLSLDTRQYVISAMKHAGAFEVLAKEQTAANELYDAILRAVASKRPSDEAQP